MAANVSACSFNDGRTKLSQCVHCSVCPTKANPPRYCGLRHHPVSYSMLGPVAFLQQILIEPLCMRYYTVKKSELQNTNLATQVLLT